VVGWGRTHHIMGGSHGHHLHGGTPISSSTMTSSPATVSGGHPRVLCAVGRGKVPCGGVGEHPWVMPPWWDPHLLIHRDLRSSNGEFVGWGEAPMGAVCGGEGQGGVGEHPWALTPWWDPHDLHPP